MSRPGAPGVALHKGWPLHKPTWSRQLPARPRVSRALLGEVSEFRHFRHCISRAAPLDTATLAPGRACSGPAPPLEAPIAVFDSDPTAKPPIVTSGVGCSAAGGSVLERRRAPSCGGAGQRCPAALSSLSDDLIVSILAALPQQDRLRCVALVSRRLRRLCASPVLLSTVAVCLSGEASLRRAQALLPWLGRHARHIRRLECRLVGGGAACGDAAALAELGASCLATACVNARRLRGLVVHWAAPLPTLSWLPLVGPTLEQLTIRLVGQPLLLDACMGGMAALRDARLSADAIRLSPGVRLPPRLSSLMFFNETLHPDAGLPHQVAALAELADLRVMHAAVRDSFPVLPEAVASLVFHSSPVDLRWLGRHPSLRRLQLTGATVPREGLDAALRALTALTCLLLPATEAPPAGLAALPRLHRLYVDCRSCFPPLPPPGPWTAALRWLCATPRQLMASLGVLRAAAALERLSVRHTTGGPPAQLLEALRTEWEAVVGWAEAHPPLAHVELMIQRGAPSLPIFYHASLLRLQRRRPALTVSTLEWSTTGARSSDFATRFLSDP